MTVRVQLSITPDMLALIDDRAKKLALTRSAFVTMCCARQIQADDVIRDLPKFLSTSEDMTRHLDRLQDQINQIDKKSSKSSKKTE